jgi:hypothetical protein
MARSATGFLEASGIYVDLLDRDPATKEQLHQQGYSPQLLVRLERVGRRALKPELFLTMNPGLTALSRCSITDQERFSTGPVAVFDPESREERLIRVDELSPEQIRMVFARDSIRSVAQQRTWWSAKHQVPPPAEADLTYRIKKDCIAILKPMIVRKETLLDWLRQIA